MEMKCAYFFSKKEPEPFIAEVEKLCNQNINEVIMIQALIRYYINLFVVCSKIEIIEMESTLIWL